VLVGLLVSVAAIGWQWPQLFVGNRIEHVHRKMPVYVVSVVVRVSSLCAMTASVLLFWKTPLLLYWLVLLWTAVMTSAGGLCVIPFMDIVAKSVPPVHRPMLFAYRRMFGGTLGALAGLATVYILSPASGLEYPTNYAVLLVAGLSLSALAYSLFMRTREPIEPVLAQAAPFLVFLKRGAALFREDRDFRRYYAYRVVLALAMMSQVLFVPLAIDRFEAPVKSTGWFSAVVALVVALSSIFWGWLSRRHGETALFRWGTGLLFLAPSSALALVLLGRHPAASAWVSAHYLWACLFMFACLSAARNGTDIAGIVYLLALPPPGQRPAYMAFMNTLSAPLMLAPVLAGVLVSRTSYGVAFAVSCVAALVALGIAFRLRQQG